ncbi:MAG TPA: hypothetical protein VEU51_08850 [Candidatus Acidoferrales bacterium]|nr:hypothetical protein [Candidatus Acidoferrales bacterium]
MASFVPAAAFAQESIDLTPPSANNPFDTDHTVTAQTHNLGVCAEVPGNLDPAGDDTEGSPCTTDSDCGGEADDFCDYAGVVVGFQVTGVNSKDTNTVTQPDPSGVVTFTYHDDNGVGVDTIQACADVRGPDGGESTSECLGEVGDDSSDIGSDPVTKNWIPTVVVSPPGAFNKTGGTHTVVATLNGAQGHCAEGPGVCSGNPTIICKADSTCASAGAGTCTGIADPDNDGDTGLCTTDSQCDGGTEDFCSFSGYLVGIKTVGASVNAADSGFKTTDALGQVSFTYTGTNAGADFIRACADLANDTDLSVGDCISDADSGGGDQGAFDDVASTTARKVWSDQFATLTPLVEFNPIGVQHTLTATLNGFPNICSNAHTTTCTGDGDCPGAVVGSCGQTGYTVFFAAIGTCVGGNNGGATCTSNGNCDSGVCSGGANVGELGSSTTTAGVATKSYTSTVETQDKLQACVDADPPGVVDDGSFIECFRDAGGENDIPTNTVIKNWFANFVTGGGGVNVGAGAKKKNLQNSGNVGRAGQAGVQGDWQSVSQIGTKTVACHFNTFTSLVFSGPATTSPPSTHNTATFTTGPGKCNDGVIRTETVTIVDAGEGKKAPRDTLNVVSSDAALFGTGGTLPLATGNYQVHNITP